MILSLTLERQAAGNSHEQTLIYRFSDLVQSTWEIYSLLLRCKGLLEVKRGEDK